MENSLDKKINLCFLLHNGNRLFNVMTSLYKLKQKHNFVFNFYNDNPNWELPIKKICYPLIGNSHIDVGLNTQENVGTFMARIKMIKKLRWKEYPVMFLDDDDPVLSNLAELIMEDDPKSIIYYQYYEIKDRNLYNEMTQNKQILMPGNYKRKRVVDNWYVSGNLYNGPMLSEFAKFVTLNQKELIDDVFGTSRIISGEDDLFNSLFSRFCYHKGVEEPTKLEKITALSSEIEPRRFRYTEEKGLYSSETAETEFREKVRKSCDILNELMKDETV